MKPIRLLLLLTAVAFFSSCAVIEEAKAQREKEMSSGTTKLIQDCPDKIIINDMPGARYRYYIYMGEKRSSSEFDNAWIRENCYNIETEIMM